MIAGYAKGIGCSQPCQVRNPFVQVKVARTVERGLQQAFISQPLSTSVFSQTLKLQQHRREHADPTRLAHLARALNVSRYSLMNFRPSLSSSSTAGSYGVSK